MVTNAERLRDSLERDNEMDSPVFKIANDPRVTPVGKFLRKTSLDEFPQLFNILKGEMSFVGPRPPIPEEVKKYETWQMRRLSMKPGLTCLWQVNGRNKINFNDWMTLDMKYIDDWSLWLDLKIFLKTFYVVLKGGGQ
jgi:lipopolysaccharide/colanic/teichoic acid biosynthesis glycosyltransferase